MKRIRTALAALLALALAFALSGCGSRSKNPLVGTWEYADPDRGMEAVYELKRDGSGSYTILIDGQRVSYALRYELRDEHFLVSFVDTGIFSEDEVFDNEFSLRDAKTMVIRDPGGEELTFIRK